MDVKCCKFPYLLPLRKIHSSLKFPNLVIALEYDVLNVSFRDFGPTSHHGTKNFPEVNKSFSSSGILPEKGSLAKSGPFLPGSSHKRTRASPGPHQRFCREREAHLHIFQERHTHKKKFKWVSNVASLLIYFLSGKYTIQ